MHDFNILKDLYFKSKNEEKGEKKIKNNDIKTTTATTNNNEQRQHPHTHITHKT